MSIAGRSFYAALVAGAVALGGFTLSASAATMVPSMTAGMQSASAGDVVEINHQRGHQDKHKKKYKNQKHHSHKNRHYNHNKKWSYHKNNHGHRYRHRRHGYTHYYGGYYYAQPWWLPGYGGYGYGYGGPTIVIRP